MKTLIFLVLLLQAVFPQQDSLRKVYLNEAASHINETGQDIEKFFGKFFSETPQNAAALQLDTNTIYYFDVVFNSKPDYNLTAKIMNLDFNHPVEDKNCGSKRNGILLLEKTERTPPKKKEPEKLHSTFYVLIPLKCTSTRFYNEKGDMCCNNKREYQMDYEEGTKTAALLKVRVGIQLLPESAGDLYESEQAPKPNYPVETHLKEYVLRCCMRSITIIKGDQIFENFVSLKQ